MKSTRTSFKERLIKLTFVRRFAQNNKSTTIDVYNSFRDHKVNNWALPKRVLSRFGEEFINELFIVSSVYTNKTFCTMNSESVGKWTFRTMK